MKLSEINLPNIDPAIIANYTEEQLAELYRSYINNYGNFYQELEMDHPHLSIHSDKSYSHFNVSLHSHSFYEILLSQSGSLQYLIGQDRYHILPGDIIVVPPNVSHRPIFFEEFKEPYTRLIVWLSEEYINLLQNAMPNITDISDLKTCATVIRGSSKDHQLLKDAMEYGYREATQKKNGFELQLYSSSLTIISLILRLYKSDNYREKTEKKELIDEIISFIENNLSDKLSLQNVSKEFAVSQSTVSKLFNSRLNVSFYQFVTQRRLINAKTLIARRLPMDQVAMESGFNDYSAFYRAFKQEYGISPRQYLNEVI